MSEGRERDLVLAPNEYAYILDETKGHVVAYVGPHKTSLANTDRPVTFEPSTRRFVRCVLEEAITAFPFAEEGWYVVVENPSREGDEEHPKPGPNNLPRLTSGRKVNIPGPVTFPLWPGQVARVICGHHLRSNQYLVVQVYNEEAARENWKRAVMKPQRPDAEPVEAEVPELTMGKLLVIRGTDVSFYIPPTGVEVVPDANGSYVREAATLERLEYCILLDEDGNKRFIRGPAVVFPEPTETFVERNASRKFRAIELNELSGIYIKVIAPYTDESGEHREGEELFITGRDQMIYFPRPEHAIVKYGDRDIHYAVAIPAGDAVYVLDRLGGEVTLRRGPAMFLPDPRREVIVRRVLPEKACELYYPGNSEALAYNRRLMGMTRDGSDLVKASEVAARPAGAKRAEAPRQGFAGDDFTRAQDYTPPRTITLDTRYEGAVCINVWTGYAVLVVGKNGQRKVVVGPATYLLEYDESLEAVELSTGTPKTDEDLFQTVYLRVLNNKVSDVVAAETADLCQVRVTVSYRVNFEGPPEQWFNVENYVKFLTDHMRSLLRNAIKGFGLENFYNDSIRIVRDALLGAAGAEGGRPGRRFTENGMHVYDVEVLDVSIGDEKIADMLIAAQHTAVQQAISIAAAQRELDATRRNEEIAQHIAEARSATVLKELVLKSEEVRSKASLTQEEILAEGAAERQKLEGHLQRQDGLDRLREAELGRERKRRDLDLSTAQQELEQKLALMDGETQSVIRKAEAVSPDLVAALQAYADKALAERVAETMAPLAILGGRSVGEVFGGLLRGTSLEGVLERGRNGDAKPARKG
jgi:major vault protein